MDGRSIVTSRRRGGGSETRWKGAVEIEIGFVDIKDNRQGRKSGGKTLTAGWSINRTLPSINSISV
jgi:hypothetical protein